MKTFGTDQDAHYQQEVQTVATCLKVSRHAFAGDTAVYGFTDIDQAFPVAGVTYVPGFELSALQSTSDLSVDNMELTILPDEVSYPLADILAGKWNGADFELFQVNYKSVADGTDTLKMGKTGAVRKRRSSYVVEFRSFKQALQQNQGIATSKTCRARLGDTKCTKSLTSFTYTGALTAAADKRHVTDSSRAEADDWFAEGVMTFVTGANAGLSVKVKAFAAGAFIFSLPLFLAPVIGDTYSVVAGCRKRRTEDCKTKFDNVLNFQGEPDLPGLDALTKPASVAAPATSPTPPVMPAGDAGGPGGGSE